MDYDKTPLTTKQHIEQLKQRGLVINNESHASQYLTTIGYYRLSAYFVPFEKPSDAANTRNHNFKDNADFENVLALYIFDRKLRLIVMEAIERIEVAVRTKWANALAEQTDDPHAFMQASNFNLKTSFKPYCGRFLLDIYRFFRTFSLTVWVILLSGQITEKSL